MRSCTQCSRLYGDETRFCLDDGTPLLPASQADTAMRVGPMPAPPVAANAATQHAASAETQAPATLDDGATHPQMPHTVAGQLAAGAIVGEYVVERKIGEGGMGVIFAASHPIIGKRVAIKVLNPAMAADPEVVARFVQEAKSVNQIHNRNIVDIFSFGILPDGRHYFVMEFLEGESMAGRLQRGRPPWFEALDIWLQVAGAVEAAHKKGIVHRDLKPDNIFLVPAPEGVFVKVLDFGIAKLMGDGAMGMSKTVTGMPIGTPTYMSPEQAGGTMVDHRTDLYAFGVILFECIAGRPPFQSPTLVQLLTAHISEPPPPIASLAQTVHPDLAALVDNLLAKEPSQRPPNMGEVRAKLIALRDAALAHQTPLYGDAMPAIAPRPAARKGSSRAPMLVGGALVAIAAVAGVILAARPKPAPPAVVEKPVLPPVVAPPAVPAGPRPGKVALTSNAQSMRVYLDKSATEKSASPVAAGGGNLRITVPPNVDWVLRVEADGFKTYSMPLKIGDGEEMAQPIMLVADAPVKTPHTGGGKKPATPTEKPPGPKKTEDGKFMNPFDN